MEPRGIATYARPLRPVAQRHHYQPDLRSAGTARVGAGVCDVPRDAASALSGGSQGVRRRVHTKEFREAERKFPQLKEAKEILKRL